MTARRWVGVLGLAACFYPVKILVSGVVASERRRFATSAVGVACDEGVRDATSCSSWNARKTQLKIHGAVRCTAISVATAVLTPCRTVKKINRAVLGKLPTFDALDPHEQI